MTTLINQVDRLHRELHELYPAVIRRARRWYPQESLSECIAIERGMMSKTDDLLDECMGGLAIWNDAINVDRSIAEELLRQSRTIMRCLVSRQADLFASESDEVVINLAPCGNSVQQHQLIKSIDEWCIPHWNVHLDAEYREVLTICLAANRSDDD